MQGYIGDYMQHMQGARESRALSDLGIPGLNNKTRFLVEMCLSQSILSYVCVYIYMVGSPYQRAPIWTPKYYSPSYLDTQEGAANFGHHPPYHIYIYIYI